MTRFPGLDPEVIADLRRREATEGDRDRTRSAALAFGDPLPVEHWPCRGGCGRMVGVPQAAIDVFAMMQQRAGGTLSKAKVMWCQECKRRDDELAQAQRRPHEQQQIAGLDTERPSGMRQAGKGRP